MIEIIGTELNQWDVGRLVQITGIEARYAHFANKGDSKAVIMDVVDKEAKIPDYLLQTGKPLCVYAVKNGITIESRTFYVKNRERPESYVYEDDQRNYIYKLIANAEQAVEDANLATENAILAAEGANTSVVNANTATENANKAADSANEASKNANEAASKAAHTAKSLMVVGTEEGTGISLDDAIEQYLVGLRIFGKSTQDGTPTPDAPVDIVSAGDGGSITVNVTGDNESQSLTISTPNGLPGIPVTSGGNYTDANGQRWICDEIDFANGVYVKRIQKDVFDGTESWAYYNSGNNPCFTTTTQPATRNAAMSSCFKHFNYPYTLSNENTGFFGWDSSNKYLYFASVESSVADWKAWLATNPVTVIYALATPIETSLSEEELAAYVSLHTYRDNTTVSNDAGAYMEIEYVMDAKKYIDSMLQPPAVRIAQVKLLASAWSGSGNLYSQVVTIDGITENSQVNLTPSIQQLAIFYEKNITFSTVNEGGVVTVYVIGQKPVNDYTIQADIVEVIV